VTASHRLGPDDLIASAYSVARVGRDGRARVAFADRVANAAAAGFRAIGTSPGDYTAIRQTGLSDDDIAGLLDEHGLVIGEIDDCPLWTGDGEPDATSVTNTDTVLHLAERFGPVHHTIVPLGTWETTLPPPEALASRLRALTMRCDAVGLLVSLEFLPWGPVPDAPAAWAYAAAADHPGCGMNVDFWHHHTGAATEAALRAVPGGRVHSVHFTDGEPDLAEPDPLMRTRTQRRVPGEGVFPMVETVRLLDALGVDVPYTVEVVSLPHRSLPPAEFAEVLYRATRSVLEVARA
jgi:sugar phosphate isomerase/epimerase